MMDLMNQPTYCLGTSLGDETRRTEPDRGGGSGHDQRGGRGWFRVPGVPRVLSHDAQETTRLRPGERTQGNIQGIQQR